MLGHLIPYHFASDQRGGVPAHRTHLLEMVRRRLQERRVHASNSAPQRSPRSLRLASILSWLR